MAGTSPPFNNTKRAPFQGALFDMDGLLLDTERVCMRVFNEVVSGFGLPAMPEVILACIGLRADATQKIIDTALAGRVAYPTFDTEWRGQFAEALSTGIPLRPGALELLSQLSAQGVPCAVATSTRTASAEKHLEHAGLRGHFMAVIGGEQVEKGKPEPDIYLKAAATLGVNAQYCAAFEDSDPGALAAIASGAMVVQVPDIKPPSADLRTKGHVIAESLLAGAREIGLIKA